MFTHQSFGNLKPTDCSHAFSSASFPQLVLSDPAEVHHLSYPNPNKPVSCSSSPIWLLLGIHVFSGHVPSSYLKTSSSKRPPHPQFFFFFEEKDSLTLIKFQNEDTQLWKALSQQKTQGCVRKNVSRRYQGPKHNRDVAVCSSSMPPVPGAGLLPAPADFGKVAVLRARVQVSAEVLSSLLVGSGCFLQDPFHLPLLLPLLKCRLGWCPLVQSAPLLLLVLFARSHRFQESRLVFVFLFLLLLSHSELRDAFQLQGPPLDLLAGLHGLLESSGRKTPHFLSDSPCPNPHPQFYYPPW